MISASNLTKKFGEFTAVDNISFDVAEGEIFGFLGPNGAGKSTTIKMLTTLLHPDSGKIQVNGFDPVRHKEKVRASFGIVFQDPSLDEELTAYENMHFHAVLYKVASNIRAQRIEELLTLVDLWDKRKEYVKNYSGGMKRRLEIARGFLHHPRIIFLDEPTLGLDPQTRNYMWNYIQDLNQNEGTTIFFTTHYMEEADRNSDRIAIIDHGKIVIQGTPSELKLKTGKESLEDAFLSLTGSSIREEGSSNIDRLRMRGRQWRNSRR
jgi:ABC-2 type transport system ATP-binding protein